MRRLVLTRLGRCKPADAARTARSACSALSATRPLATVVPPPPPGANVEKLPGDNALSRADSRDAAASEEQAAGAGIPLGPGSPPPPPPGSDLEKEKAQEQEAAAHAGGAEPEAPPLVIEVGPPVTARVETVVHDAEDPLVAPSEIQQEGTATTTLKGRPNTMAAPELQGGG
jgi:hypothetical protein